ncbi:MAG: AI-2E family transporter [Gammaproteobacteria bacterium]|nr:AI-2E family transporter [Gammaproteobacteria bacterium]
MNIPTVSRFDLFAWALFVGGLLILLPLKLLPALIAGLLVYALVNAMVPNLRTPVLGEEGPGLLAVALIAAAVITIIILAGAGLASFLRHSGENVPALIQGMAEILEGSRDRLPPWLLQYLPDDAEDLRRGLVRWLRDHASTFQVAGAELARALGHILLGMVVGALLSLESAVFDHNRGPLAQAFAERGVRLAQAFRRVVFAQFWISSINTGFTAIYLTIALPWLGIELPFTKTLILVTFIAGLLPILGNLISNTIIFIVSLSQSLFVALGSLAYLIIIHKLEYFLNVRIIGGLIRARAWEMLIAMLVMEAAFGIAGLIAAPIYYAYLKDELSAKGFV